MLLDYTHIHGYSHTCCVRELTGCGGASWRVGKCKGKYISAVIFSCTKLKTHLNNLENNCKLSL